MLNPAHEIASTIGVKTARIRQSIEINYDDMHSLIATIKTSETFLTSEQLKWQGLAVH